MILVALLASSAARAEEPAAPYASVRARFFYANYSGEQPFLPPGEVQASSDNLSGDGPGLDLLLHTRALDLGATGSVVLVAARAPSWQAAATIGKSIAAGRWRMSFATGFGMISLEDASGAAPVQRLRPAFPFVSGFDHYLTDRLYWGLQVQSWVALGPEEDLGLGSGSIGVGIDLR